MNIQTNNWVFQDDATTTGDGTTYKSGRNDQLTIYITNTANSYTVYFEGCDSEATPNWYPIPAIKLPELTTATSTTSNTNEAWVINLAQWVGVRCRISAITGGAVRITGRVVDAGTSLLKNLTDISGIETSLTSLVNKDFATQQTLAILANKDFATQQTLANVLTALDNMPIILAKGTTTEASVDSITVTDDTKDFGLNMFPNKTIKLTINNIDYYRKILGCIENTIAIDPIQEGTVSTVTLTGTSSGASINIATQAVGDNIYSIVLTPNTSGTPSQPMSSTMTDNVLTITSSTDEFGVAELFYVTNLSDFFANDPDELGLDTLFTVTMNVVGALDNVETPVAFSGGSAMIIIPDNTEYEIIDQLEGINILGKAIPVDTDGDEKFTSANPASVIGTVGISGNKITEQKIHTDATKGVVTFADNINAIEIYNTDASNDGIFVANGISLHVPANTLYRTSIGGTVAKTVTVSGATTYILSNLV